MRLNFKFLVAIFLLIVTVASAQIKVWKNPRASKTITTQQWEVNDFVYIAKNAIEKPFSKSIYAVVQSEQGEQKIPLFYNGGKEWVLRYSSAEIGKKTFKIQGDIKGVSGKKGKIDVIANTKVNRHGGIVSNPKDKRHFYYQDGSPYFNLAFECDWLFALDYNQKQLPKTTHLLDLIEKNGFNQVVMNVYAHGLDFDWVRDERLQQNPQHNYGSREDIFPFLGSNSKPDYSSLNVDFFKHFDRVISEMHNRELVSHLMIYVWNKRVAWPKAGTEADNMYYDNVIKRYQAFPNIIWDVSKEAANKIAREQNINIVEHLEERIKRTRKLDSYNRLVSVHDYGFCRKHKDEVDFISIQNWRFQIHDDMSKAYKAFPDKPVFNIEHGGYEESPYNVFPGGYSNAEACLRRNYLCLFGGTYTTYYWQATAWTAVIHNPFEQDESFKKPHFEYFKYMSDFFKTYQFQNFQPVSGFNTRSYNLTNYKEGQILLYVPKEVYHADVKRQLDKEFDYSNATWQWFNTVTGDYTQEKKIEFKHKYGFWDWRPFRNEGDAILIVKGLKSKK
ncbi:hypothetical protein [Wenyingzhuangia sp. IMCC45574]